MRTRLLAIVALLALAAGGLAGTSAQAGKIPTKLPEDKVRGRELYQDLCWQCHGVEGRGDGPLAALLGTPPGDLRGRDEAAWPGLVDQVLRGSGDMPAFSDSLDRHEARRIFTWLAALDAAEANVMPTRRAPAQPVDTEAVLAGPADGGSGRGAAAPEPEEEEQDEAR